MKKLRKTKKVNYKQSKKEFRKIIGEILEETNWDFPAKWQPAKT